MTNNRPATENLSALSGPYVLMRPVVARGIRRDIVRNFTLGLAAAALVLMASEVASAQEFCIATTLTGGATRNFKATFMSASAGQALISVIDPAAVNAIGFGSFAITPGILAPITVVWTIMGDGVVENYDCRLFTPTQSGGGNQLTVKNTGNTRIQLTNCILKATC
jgi:hypothetical protein